jgi:hypothetical protein
MPYLPRSVLISLSFQLIPVQQESVSIQDNDPSSIVRRALLHIDLARKAVFDPVTDIRLVVVE